MPWKKRKSPIEQRLDAILILRQEKKFKEADLAGENALKLFPDNPQILSAHCDTAIRAKNFAEAIQRLGRLLSIQDSGHDKDLTLLRLIDLYVGLGQIGAAEDVADEALEQRPTSLVMRCAKAELGLMTPERRFDVFPWLDLAFSPGLKSSADAIRIKTVAACVSGLRLVGRAQEASRLLAIHFDPRVSAWKEQLADGFGKVLIFNNGATQVEFHTRLFDPVTLQITEASKLAITFDSMEQTWNKESFAYKPLSAGCWDLLAVRKRTKEDFHQDFSREEFVRVAAPVAKSYQQVVALGQSLGAYSALYYASWIAGCRVLATAPRNPLNPKYSAKRYSSYRHFRHEYDMPLNPAATPTIVYDPKNREDGRYVKKSLKVRFPNATLVPYPYCGHSITRYLRDIGTLKSATIGFCEGHPFPEYNPALRGNSAEYLRNVAKLTLTAGRLKWARALAGRALALGQDRERSSALLDAIEAAAKARS